MNINSVTSLCLNTYFVFYSGFDDQLARHFAYLFIRDPISLFEEKLQQDPDTETDHFEVTIIIVVSIFVIIGVHYRTFSLLTG